MEVSRVFRSVGILMPRPRLIRPIRRPLGVIGSRHEAIPLSEAPTLPQTRIRASVWRVLSLSRHVAPLLVPALVVTAPRRPSPNGLATPTMPLPVLRLLVPWPRR